MSTIVHTRFPSFEAAELAEHATEHLRTYFRHVVNVTWTFALEHDEVVARCDVHAHAGHFHGEGRDGAMTTAINEVVHRITTQRRRQKRMAHRSMRALRN